MCFSDPLHDTGMYESEKVDDLLCVLHQISRLPWANSDTKAIQLNSKNEKEMKVHSSASACDIGVRTELVSVWSSILKDTNPNLGPKFYLLTIFQNEKYFQIREADDEMIAVENRALIKESLMLQCSSPEKVSKKHSYFSARSFVIKRRTTLMHMVRKHVKKTCAKIFSLQIGIWLQIWNVEIVWAKIQIYASMIFFQCRNEFEH